MVIVVCAVWVFFFFFKQKTAYEMRISDWSSDVCSSDLDALPGLIEAAQGKALLLVLDGVQDPHNLGACLRSAAAAGATAVVIPKDKAVQVNATVRQTSAGAADSVPVVRVTNLSRTLREVQKLGRSEEHTSELQSPM